MTVSAAHVLILEDDDGLLALASRVLRKRGHRVTAVAQAEAARQVVEQERPDLLIVDYNLQTLESGLDFFRSLRAGGIVLPAIMVSGVSDELRIIEAFRAGMADVLPKTSDYLDFLPATVERVLQQLQQQRAHELQQRQQLDAWREDFLTTLSQQLRTPLNAILGWVHYLQRDASDLQQLQRGLQVIERNALQQAQQIEELLDLSRILSGKLRIETQVMLLADAVRAALSAVQPAANAKGIALQVSLSEQARVLGDPQRLQQVVWHLLMNAIKFTPAQGRVAVTLTAQGDQVELEVADNGQGIAPERLAQVFERGERADVDAPSQADALGLGLSLVRRLVESHGGQVDAFSNGVGQGARLLVRLPMLPMLPSAARPAA